MPLSPGVSTSSAPKAANSRRRSRDMVSGMVRILSLIHILCRKDLRILLDGAVKQYFFRWKVTIAQPLRYTEFLRNICNRRLFIAFLAK